MRHAEIYASRRAPCLSHVPSPVVVSPEALMVVCSLLSHQVWVNQYNLLNNNVPFGGKKQSGIGAWLLLHLRARSHCGSVAGRRPLLASSQQRDCLMQGGGDADLHAQPGANCGSSRRTGRELGSYALEEYTSVKAIHWNYGEKLDWPL